MLIIHILSALTVGYIFSFWKKDEKIYIKEKENIEIVKNFKINEFGEILGNSIKKAINTILNIGGFIVIFSVIISILEESNFFFIISYILDMYGWNGEFFIGILKGILELTNGVKTVSLQGNLPLNIGIISFLMGFGGISVMFQVYSIISKENISIKPYLLGKILQGIIAFSYTMIFFICFK